MTEGRRADSARRRQRVLNALDTRHQRRRELSVTGIARRAGVDRTFLYRHRDLLEQLHAAATQPPDKPEIGPPVTRASLQADLLAAQQRCARMAARTQQLEAVDRPLPIRRRRLHRRDLDAVMHSQSRITRNEPNIVLNVRVSLRLPRRAPGVRRHTVTESFPTSSPATRSNMTSTTAPFPVDATLARQPGTVRRIPLPGHRPTRS